MTAESAFSLLNTVALVGWVLMIALPGRRWVTEIATRMAIPAGSMVATIEDRFIFTSRRGRGLRPAPDSL